MMPAFNEAPVIERTLAPSSRAAVNARRCAGRSAVGAAPPSTGPRWCGSPTASPAA